MTRFTFVLFSALIVASGAMAAGDVHHPKQVRWRRPRRRGSAGK